MASREKTLHFDACVASYIPSCQCGVTIEMIAHEMFGPKPSEREMARIRYAFGRLPSHGIRVMSAPLRNGMSTGGRNKRHYWYSRESARKIEAFICAWNGLKDD